MLNGDTPYTKELADNYAMSDNYHQPAMGGTGLDSIMLGFGDALWFSDENGNPLVPPNPSMQDGYGGFGNNGASTGEFGGGT